MSLPTPPPPPGALAGGIPPMMMRGGMPPRAALPTTILLTNLPVFLQSNRGIRDFIASCGSARSVLIYPPPPKYDENGNIIPENDQKTEESIPPPETSTALVVMSHTDGALRLAASFRRFKERLSDENFAAFSIYSVPTNPDIPVPPLGLDAASVETLSDKLMTVFQQLQENDSQQAGTKGNVKKESGEDGSSTTDANRTSVNPPTSNNTQPNDENKSSYEALMATGGYDDDVDPLDIPQVQEAVREFRKNIERLQGSKAGRRKEVVARKIEQLLPNIRKQMQEERERAKAAAAAAPPLPSGVPPLPPPPPPSAAGPRGVSNMPAWMANQEQASSADGAPPSKRIKLDPNAMDPSLSFPAVPEVARASLRVFVAERIKHFLGEEEQTLIDFILQHVLDRKPCQVLLDNELKDVLDEDAQPFLLQLWDKVQELAFN